MRMAGVPAAATALDRYLAASVRPSVRKPLYRLGDPSWRMAWQLPTTAQRAHIGSARIGHAPASATPATVVESLPFAERRDVGCH
jgi:hypothetical protein